MYFPTDHFFKELQSANTLVQYRSLNFKLVADKATIAADGHAYAGFHSYQPDKKLFHSCFQWNSVLCDLWWTSAVILSMDISIIVVALSFPLHLLISVILFMDCGNEWCSQTGCVWGMETQWAPKSSSHVAKFRGWPLKWRFLCISTRMMSDMRSYCPSHQAAAEQASTSLVSKQGNFSQSYSHTICLENDVTELKEVSVHVCIYVLACIVLTVLPTKIKLLCVVWGATALVCLGRTIPHNTRLKLYPLLSPF